MSSLPQKRGTCSENDIDNIRKGNERTEPEMNTPREVNSKRSQKKPIKKQQRGRALRSKTNTNISTDEFFLNEIVFATIPGYAPWPACILNINSETYYVRFFGSGEMFVFNEFLK